MSDFLVVDSSVVIKWFPHSDEDRCVEALDLLAQHRDQQLTLAAPTLVWLEVLNAFWKRQASADDMAELADILDAFDIEWFEVTAGLASDAGRIAAEYQLTVYDATFVALTRQLDAELVTEDSAIIRSRACAVRVLGG